MVLTQSINQNLVYSQNQNLTNKPAENQHQLFNNNFFLALKSKSNESYIEALNYFQKCMKIDHTKSTPFYESAVINKNNGNFDLAIEQIKNAVKIDRKNRWYRLTYAEILFKTKQFKEAAYQYKKLIEQEPGNQHLYLMLSDTYIYNNELVKAIGVYDDLEEYKGIEKELSLQKYKLYLELNNTKKAILELVALHQEFPQDIEVMEILSELYLLTDEKDKSFELFKKIAVLEPNNGRVHLTLADYYRKKGDNIQSYNQLKLAFKSTKLSVDTKIRILVSYYQLIQLNSEMRSQAYELAEILTNLYPKDISVRGVYADILYTDNKFEEAKKQYLLVLEQDKNNSQIWLQVLFIQAEGSDFEGMLKTSSEALDYFPANPLIYYFNGVSNKWQKKIDKAIISFETGIDFVVDNDKLLLEFYSSLGDSYHSIGQHDMSDKYYEKALAIDPENVVVLNNYAYYLSLRCVNLERAKEMSYKCNELEPNNSTYQDTYAWVLYQLKEYILANEWLLKSLENGGDKSAVIIEHYGDVLFHLEDIENAVIQWKKAKEIGGGSKYLDKKIIDKKIHE